MKRTTLNRFSQLRLRHLSTANRIVVPAMASQTAEVEGFVSERTLEHYSRLARSGAGIVMVEYTYVSTSGKSEANQLAADHDNKIAGLSSLAQRIKKSGALSFLQLTHSLAKTSVDLTGGVLLGASSIAVPVKDHTLEIPHEMTSGEITDLKEAFVAAARRAELAGFHGIELHSAHGYGLNQMLSAITNQRKDEYGGSLENRARLLFEVVSKIRKYLPQLLISVRVPGQDHLADGLTTNDMKWVVGQLESLGVDVINVSSGLGGWRRPRDRVGEGYLVEDAAILQAVLSLPVIGVGGIESAAYIEQSLQLNKFSLAAVGRAILNDPDAFAAKILKDQLQ